MQRNVLGLLTWLWKRRCLEEKRGRSKGRKRLIVVALEKVKDGVGRAYAQILEAASAEEFKPFFKNYIDSQANVITDEWVGYLPLRKKYKNLKLLLILSYNQ